jgi:Family of unknown function (DUF5908)
MPLEIKELQIKVTVSNNAQPAQSGANTSGNGSVASPQSGGNQDAIVQECVEKVLEILKDKMER